MVGHSSRGETFKLAPPYTVLDGISTPKCGIITTMWNCGRIRSRDACCKIDAPRCEDCKRQPHGSFSYAHRGAQNSTPSGVHSGTVQLLTIEEVCRLLYNDLCIFPTGPTTGPTNLLACTKLFGMVATSSASSLRSTSNFLGWNSAQSV